MNQIQNESPKETITDRPAHRECPSLFNHRPVDPGKSGECLIVERLLFKPDVVVCRFPLSLHDMSKKHMLNCRRLPHRAVRRLRLGYWSFLGGPRRFVSGNCVFCPLLTCGCCACGTEGRNMQRLADDRRLGQRQSIMRLYLRESTWTDLGKSWTGKEILREILWLMWIPKDSQLQLGLLHMFFLAFQQYTTCPSVVEGH
jgi:hypothetical protein